MKRSRVATRGAASPPRSSTHTGYTSSNVGDTSPATSSQVCAEAAPDVAVAQESDPATDHPLALVKRPRRNSEPPHADAVDDTITTICAAAPIPRPLVSPPESLAASVSADLLVGAQQAVVAPALPATAEIRAAVVDKVDRAAVVDMAALREQERAIEATYPAVPPFVRAHSLLWHNTAHSGDSAESTVASWLLCFEGCPVPLERALVVLRLLARLHAAPPAPARRVLRVLERPLEDCLSSVSRADLAAMVQVADYLQLPKALVARVTQHRAARALRVAFASTADLLAAVRDGPLRPLLRTSLAALPDPFSATPPPEQFAEVSPDLDDDPAAGPEVGPLTPQEQLQRLHADPCFLRGVCNAPYEHEVGCTCEDPLSIYLAGLLLAGHPLPSRLMESNVAVIAAVAVGNTTALGRMMENSGADPRTLSIIPFGEVAMNAAAYFGRTAGIAPQQGIGGRQLLVSRAVKWRGRARRSWWAAGSASAAVRSRLCLIEEGGRRSCRRRSLGHSTVAAVPRLPLGRQYPSSGGRR